MDERKLKIREYQRLYRQQNADKIKEYRTGIDPEKKREYNKKYRDNCTRNYNEYMESVQYFSTLSNKSV